MAKKPEFNKTRSLLTIAANAATILVLLVGVTMLLIMKVLMIIGMGPMPMGLAIITLVVSFVYIAIGLWWFSRVGKKKGGNGD